MNKARVSEYICDSDYQEAIAATRDQRMAWFREARFGMFVHFGAYSLYGRNEWVMGLENIPKSEYEKRAGDFKPRKGAAREWAKLAKQAGMKYMVFTTKHHEGYCMWDTKMTDYNCVKHGPGHDIVKEFVEACREFDLKVGLYYSLMDWHHPDGLTCAYDLQARRRFLDFTQGCVRELMSNYGPIDILWYDVSQPMQSAEGWESLQMNQMVRELQPNIIINDRVYTKEDLVTPEGAIKAGEGDWEACMTFNGISWGYVDSKQAAPDSYNVRGILKMLRKACSRRGNLLLNIGPAPDGSVPEEAVKPLQDTGRWIQKHQEVVYPVSERWSRNIGGWAAPSRRGTKVYVWTQLWPLEPAGLGGFITPLKSACILPERTPLEFEHKDHRILFTNLPRECPDDIAGMAVIELEFETDEIECVGLSKYPYFHGGKTY